MVNLLELQTLPNETPDKITAFCIDELNKKLKYFCESAEVTYNTILSHSKNGWFLQLKECNGCGTH